jgi:hypothetical protein
MPSLNESLYTTPSAKRALSLNKNLVEHAAAIRKERGLDTTYERKLATAVCLENTKRQLKVMESINGSATQPSSIGQYKRFAVDMVGALIPSLIAPDLVSIQAIDNKVGMINVLKYQYGDNGKTFNSPFGLDQDNTYAYGIKTGVLDASKQFVIPAGSNIEWVQVNGTAVTIDGSTNTYNEATGTITIGGGSQNDTIVVKVNLEDVPVKAPTIKLDIDSIPITAEAYKLQAIWSFDAQYELAKEYGQEMQKQLAVQATAEIQSEIDNTVILDLYKGAGAGPDIVWAKSHQQYISTMDHYDGFWASILEASNAIFTATKRARANFLVGGVGVDSVVRAMRNFTPADDVNAVGPHFIGTLGGLKVYVNPYLGANDAFVGYKGDTLLDAGYVLAPYMPVLTTGMVTLADDFASREGWAASYGKQMINPNLYCRIHIV